MHWSHQDVRLLRYDRPHDKKGSGLNVVNPTTLADTPAPNPKEGTTQQTKSAAHTTNPPGNQDKRIDPGGEVNSPGKSIHNAKHQDNINCNTAMIADDKPTNAKNTNFIRHLRREVAQRKTIILGVNDRENPKKSASTTHMWKKFSETINTLKAAATNRLTAATLSLSEQDGIGVLHATPNLAGDKGREDRRGKFDRKPR